MDVDIAPTRKITVFGLDKRSITNIAWCAASYGIGRLYWIDGYLLCLEVYEKSFEEEIKKREFQSAKYATFDFQNTRKSWKLRKVYKFQS
jgi:hypothetical protein